MISYLRGLRTVRKQPFGNAKRRYTRARSRLDSSGWCNYFEMFKHRREQSCCYDDDDDDGGGGGGGAW